MHIHWTQPALRDLDEALDYIRKDNPQAAHVLGQMIRTKIVLLKQFPNAGHPGKVDDTRELPLSGTPYTVVYAITDERINILRIWHGKRQWAE